MASSFLILVAGLLLHFLLTAMSDLPHPSRNQLIDPGWQIVYSALEESDDVDTPGASTEQLPESEEQPKAQAQHWNKLPHPPQYCPLNQPPTPITDGQGRYYMSHADYVRWEREEAAFSATSRSNLEHSAPPAGATITDSNHRLQSQTPITDGQSPTANHRRQTFTCGNLQLRLLMMKKLVCHRHHTCQRQTAHGRSVKCLSCFLGSFLEFKSDLY